jgi:hypothetical protein
MLCWITILGGVLIMMRQQARSEALFYYFSTGPGLITFARIPLLANSAVHVRTNERNAAFVPPALEKRPQYDYKKKWSERARLRQTVCHHNNFEPSPHAWHASGPGLYTGNWLA